MRQLLTCSFCDCAIQIMIRYFRNFEDQGYYFCSKLKVVLYSRNNGTFPLLHKTIRTDLLYKCIHNTCEARRHHMFYNRHLLQKEESRCLLLSELLDECECRAVKWFEGAASQIAIATIIKQRAKEGDRAAVQCSSPWRSGPWWWTEYSQVAQSVILSGTVAMLFFMWCVVSYDWWLLIDTYLCCWVV